MDARKITKKSINLFFIIISSLIMFTSPVTRFILVFLFVMYIKAKSKSQSKLQLIYGSITIILALYFIINYTHYSNKLIFLKKLKIK